MRQVTNTAHLYTISRWAYSIGQPIISDAEYDILQRVMYGSSAVEKEATWSMEGCPTELLREYGLDHLIREVELSGEKSESIVSINSESEARSYYAEREGRLYHVSLKMDGWNMQPWYRDGVYVKTESRGRTRDAIDASALSAVLPSEIGCKGIQRVYGEAILTAEALEELQRLFPEKNYKYRRSAVSGALANAPHLLTFYAFGLDDDFLDVRDKFEQLQAWGFTVPPHTLCRAENVVDTVCQLSESRDYSLSTDGVVIYGTGNGLAKDVRALRLFSWKNNLFISKIIGYSESTGRHYVGLKLLIEPVETPSGVQREIDIDNLDRVCRYNLLPGKFVVFEKVSAAVEHINMHLTMLANEHGGLSVEELR